MPTFRSALATAGVATVAVTLACGPSVLEVALAADRAEELAQVAAQSNLPSAPVAPEPTPSQAPTPPPSPTQVPTPTAAPTAKAKRGGSTSTHANPPATNAAGKPVVYVTIDDGPDPTWTPQVLALLAQYDATATFFVIGEEAARFPAVLKSVRDAGHAIGNHTYTHPWLTHLPPSGVRAELAKTDAVIGTTTCMRPPGGFVDARVEAIAAAAGKTVELWKLDTRDWAHPGVPAIVSAATKGVHAGSVILLHDGGGPRAQSVAALKQILPILTARGFALEALPACR